MSAAAPPPTAGPSPLTAPPGDTPHHTWTEQEPLRALQRVTAPAELSFSDKVAALLEMGCRRLGAPTGVLSRVEDGWFHVLEAHAPAGELARGSRLPLEQLFCAATLALGDALAIDHAGASALAAHPCRTARGVEAYLGTPVSVAGRGYGTLSFFGPRPRTVPFSEGDRDFLRLMSQWVGAELERQRTLAELRAGEARYRTLVESASDLIFSTDAAGTLTCCNPAALRALGLAADEAVGRPALALVRPDAREGARAALAAQAAERREAGYLELPLRAADGREVWVGLNLQLAFDGERLEEVRAVARDITTRRELDRVHAEFVSVVSHELRTPLTALRAALGLLAAGRAGPVPEEGRRLLEIAVGNTDRLARLVGDIVEMEGLQSGRAALRVEEVHAATLLARAADAASEAAQRQGVHLAVRAVPARLHADAARLRQVLAHLLDNALKFSPRGGTVTLAATREGGELRLRVSDGGPGIPADGLEAVFERFRQGDSSDTRGAGGTGLGLALCRGIVEQHGGRIWAESPPGGGATLWVALPIAEEGTGDSPGS